MDWKNGFFLCFTTYLLVAQTSAQYIVLKTPNNYGYQNLPTNTYLPQFNNLQIGGPNLPISNVLANQPLDKLLLITNAINEARCGCNQIRNILQNVPINNLALALANNVAGCQCKRNNIQITNIPQANMPVAYSLPRVANNIQGLQNLQVQRLNLPIGNNVLGGVLQVTTNPPIANLPVRGFQTCLNPNAVQILGNKPLNYQNSAGVQYVNNILRQPYNNLANVPIQNLANVPTQNIKIVPKQNLVNVPNSFGINQQFNSIATLPINNQNILIRNTGSPSINNFATLPVNYIQSLPNYNVIKIQGNNLGNFPLTDVRKLRINQPLNNVANLLNNNVPNFASNNLVIPTNTITNSPLANVINMRINQPLNDFATRLISSVPKASNNLVLPMNTIAGLAINNRGITSNVVANSPVRYVATQPNGNGRCGYEQVALASSGVNKVVANVPVVPLNSLANLPVYNGMPVIKMSEAVYKLTPVKQ